MRRSIAEPEPEGERLVPLHLGANFTSLDFAVMAIGLRALKDAARRNPSTDERLSVASICGQIDRIATKIENTPADLRKSGLTLMEVGVIAMGLAAIKKGAIHDTKTHPRLRQQSIDRCDVIAMKLNAQFPDALGIRMPNMS